MKWDKWGPRLGWTAAGLGVVGTLLGGCYAVLLGMGFVVSRAGAQTMIAQAQQPYDLELLEIRRTLKQNELAVLNKNTEGRAKTEDEQFEADTLRDDIRHLTGLINAIRDGQKKGGA